MLAYFLAFTVGIGSFILYMAAFFFPEIHRKNDFIWSGVGLFYALVLWVFAKRITGGLLLGHMASVALLGWFGWQTLSLRRQLTPKSLQTPVFSTEAVQNTIQEQVSKVSLPERFAQLTKGISGVFSGVKGKTKETLSKNTPQPAKPESITSVIKDTETSEAVAEAVTPIVEQIVDTASANGETEATVMIEGEIVDTTSASPEAEVSVMEGEQAVENNTISADSAESNLEGVTEEIILEPPSAEAVEAGKKLTDYFEQKYPEESSPTGEVEAPKEENNPL
jgi:Ycf66 protein N-terminus